MKECLFCAIANGSGEDLVWQNDVAAAFKDIHPKAPVHLLIVPRTHIDKLDALGDDKLAGELLMAAREVARLVGIAAAYRVHINNGRGAGQVVDHLHIHLMGNFKTSQIDDLRAEGL